MRNPRTKHVAISTELVVERLCNKFGIDYDPIGGNFYVKTKHGGRRPLPRRELDKLIDDTAAAIQAEVETLTRLDRL